MKPTLILLLALGACVSAPKRIAAPVVRPVPASPALPSLPPVAWEDRARTPGNWVYRRDGTASYADFGGGGVALFSMYCSAGNVSFLRPGPEVLMMTIITTTMSEKLLGSPDSPTHGALGTVGAQSPLLDAIIYSRGRFLVSVAGQPDLILPSWPEIARVVEDCRR